MTYNNESFTIITIIYNCKDGILILFHLPSFPGEVNYIFITRIVKYIWLQLYHFLVNFIKLGVNSFNTILVSFCGMFCSTSSLNPNYP